MMLSVVIPVYNEEKTLLEIIRRVLDVPVNMEREIVLVDDASTDGTPALYGMLDRQFPNAKIRLFRQSVNQGKGAAIRRGFAEVRGDIVLVQDADLEYDPQEYPKLLRPIVDGRADVVYGSRFLRGAEYRVLHFWHRLINSFLTKLSNMFTNLSLTDMETCYKVLRADVLKSLRLRSNRFGIEPEITAKIARGGWRVYEVAISYAARSHAEGKKIGWRDGAQAVYAIVRYAIAD